MQRFSFSVRLLSCVVLPSVLFTAALAVALWGLWRTQAEYEGYLEREQAISDALNGMLARGLAAGQAVRDLALDPSNRPARDGIQASHEQALKLAADASALAEGSSFAAPLKKIAALQQAHATLQREIVQLIRDRPGEVIQAIVDRETPSWAALGGELTRQIHAAGERAAEAQARAQRASRQAVTLAAVLAATATAAAVALCFVLVSAVRRELGGEPELARRALLRVADGDLRDDGAVNAAPPRSMLGAVQQMRLGLQTLVGRVQEVTRHVANATTEIAHGNETLRDRTEQAADNLQVAALSLRQLTDRIEHGAGVAREASEQAGSANEVATRGGDVVAQVVSTMEAISTSSQQVAEIVSVIDAIAFQTNILALNASVEAARAGEEGRGFAVVADEVRTLAGRSAQAARQIRELIDHSVAQVQQGAERVQQAGSTMEEIVQATRRVTEMMAALSQAAAEQVGDIGRVNRSVASLEAMTQGNAGLVDASAVLSARLREQAEQLAQIVGAFKLQEAEAAARA